MRIKVSISSWFGRFVPQNIVCTGSKRRDTERERYAFSNDDKTLRLHKKLIVYHVHYKRKI